MMPGGPESGVDRSIDEPGLPCPHCGLPYWRRASLIEHLGRLHEMNKETARREAVGVFG